MKYVAHIEIPTPQVGEVLETINKTMESFGFHEKLVARTRVASLNLTSNRELTAAELETAHRAHQPLVIEEFATHGFRGATLSPYTAVT